MGNFENALTVVLKHEGGYTNDPADSGGPTNWGITQHDYAVYKGHPVSAQDVKNMTEAEAAAIYLRNYWAPFHLDQIHDVRLATCIFDMGVLNGTHTAIRMAQEACGADPDGMMGPKTLEALNAGDALTIANRFLDLCDRRFEGIVAAKPSQHTFLRGWERRVEDLKQRMHNLRSLARTQSAA